MSILDNYRSSEILPHSATDPQPFSTFYKVAIPGLFLSVMQSFRVLWTAAANAEPVKSW
jgi:hypothetical protein